MTGKPRCTDETYLRAWKAEIHQGAEAGKLTLSSGRADIKTASAPTDSDVYRPKDGEG